ncbi:MAG: phage holin family protein [Candidatus Liptonbacteria bacterium]|nr:phage holin family protein [Candidatus Liptonbacteria bacterium]
MKFIGKLVAHTLANALGFWAAIKYIPGFTITGDWEAFFVLAFALTILNFVLKPILKMILGPIIILTLGFGLILVNALILYGLDRFSTNLTIETIPALIYSTILIGLINFLFHLIP